MSSTHQVSPRESNDPSSLQKATTPELQITSNDEEADIRAKMAKRKRRKAAREEAAQLEAERLKRERLEAEQCEREQMEAKQHEREQLEAERKEQERLETKHQEQEARAQQKPGEPKERLLDVNSHPSHKNESARVRHSGVRRISAISKGVNSVPTLA
ncbi:hypothetical protein M404DRAFT_23340 [Pisolithus tinctorius Marx 270]|uniref:Uncharacterized protein n=1 Tax=Pisolithus tinctorius Marx 270 TaxID=870435 RepID=A0A0C3P4S4_PISTI|nr:hypothetical protein M404DRAFT_23340 [Pisolithus tinctorius Marx 270]